MSTRRMKSGALMVAAVAALTMVFRAYTATLVVDPNGGTPYTTIQSAINAAMPGQDDVFVTCGRYPENVVMRDGVSLRGAGPGCTTIDARHLGSGVWMPRILQPTVLDGFTIRNADHAMSASAGIMVLAGSPMISRNVIEANGSHFESAPGIYIGYDFTSPSSPVITRNIIRGNRSCCAGGGILMSRSDGAVITSNVIEGNSSGYGAGMYIYGESAVVANNTIVGNVSHALGGGISGSAAITIANNVIAWNSAASGGGVFVPFVPSGELVIENNVTFQNDGGDYLLPNGHPDPNGINGNFSADPRFVDTSSSSFAGYEPRSNSPLVDRGAPAWGPATDLRGLARPIDGDADGYARVDIGARENEGLTNLRAAGLSFVWDRGNHRPETYYVYRGDLAALRQTGVYTQDPATVPGAALYCTLGTNQLTEASGPMPGQTFFYLVAAGGVVEGTLGFDGSLVERPISLSCGTFR